MKFKQLDIAGFKSFSEKTNFLIEEGLTGIVGPNGCGKSNIVEALRWCMGENSAKSMRGSGMEDVIFSGTSNRPAKNISEVSLIIENDNKKIPGPYKDFDEIIISLFVAGGDNSTITRSMFLALRDQIDPTIAAISTILIVISSGLLIIVQLIGNKENKKD